MSEDVVVRVAQIVPCTEAEGPGKRFALWFQGCPLRCPGCCNPEFLPFDGGESFGLGQIANSLRDARDQYGIEGVTLLGGEPFAHALAAAAVARIARALDLSVMVFTGYTLHKLRAKPEAAELIALSDIVVDGPYLREQPDTTRRWIGSTNQVVHFLTDRYRFDEQWLKRNTLEIRLQNNELRINGFPARNAVGLWKGWKRKSPTRTSRE